MNSSEAMLDFCDRIDKRDVVISEYGYISNLLHQTLDRNRNFYLLDKNINPVALGLGLSVIIKEKTYVLISEKTFQSRLASIIKVMENDIKNLIIIVFNFEKYEQFLQKQIFLGTLSTEINKITKALGLKSYNITKKKEFIALLKKTHNKEEPCLLELMMEKIKINESLYEMEFKKLKNRFMNSIRGD
ncbi:MAG: thiamine pyrophosphate-dependent enzyme [Candidatus Helarchaeota archaeon]